MTGGGIAHLIDEAIDDDRVYQYTFRAGEGTMEPEAGVLYEALQEEAERIEQSVGCVTAVERDESEAFGPTSVVKIIVWAILPRHVDPRLFERVFDEARHRALNAKTPGVGR
jgi:hypothetical protein